MTEIAESILVEHKLRKTKVRLEVLDVFLTQHVALSHADLEARCKNFDRVTLYRTLKSFEDGGIIHRAVDGTETARYALCKSECGHHHHHHHDHAHFRCEQCGNTICLEQVEVPRFTLPEGYTSESSHIIIKGTCQSCNHPS